MGNIANICMSFQASSTDDKEQVMSSLERSGFQPRDLSGNALAKTHGRNFMGGRAPPALTSNERLLRFEFPERPGSLYNFLDTLPSDVNVSLFHYRNHGSDVGKVLVGFQIPVVEQSRFESFLAELGSKSYTWEEETENVLYRQFLREE